MYVCPLFVGVPGECWSVHWSWAPARGDYSSSEQSFHSEYNPTRYIPLFYYLKVRVRVIQIPLPLSTGKVEIHVCKKINDVKIKMSWNSKIFHLKIKFWFSWKWVKWIELKIENSVWSMKFLSLGMPEQIITQNSQHSMAALPQHLIPTNMENLAAVLLSPPVRKTRIQQQPKQEAGSLVLYILPSTFVNYLAPSLIRPDLVIVNIKTAFCSFKFKQS